MKPALLIRELEPLNADELAFLRKKEERESRRFFKVVRIIMILCFVIPFVMAWRVALAGEEDQDPFHPGTYFMWVIFLLCLSGIGIYAGYRTYLHLIRSDLRSGTKTIEKAHITRKLYMSQNNTWYFYIDSPTRLSIEVSELDYRKMKEGDELSIEYTTHSKDYLGYF